MKFTAITVAAIVAATSLNAETTAPVAPMTAAFEPHTLELTDFSFDYQDGLLVEVKSRSRSSSSRSTRSTRSTKPRSSTTQRSTKPRSTTTQRSTKPSSSTTQRSTTQRSATTQRSTRTVGTTLPQRATTKPATNEQRQAAAQQRNSQISTFQNNRRATSATTRNTLRNSGQIRGNTTTTRATNVTRTRTTSAANNRDFVSQRRAALSNRRATSTRSVNLRDRNRRGWNDYDNFYTPSVYYGARPSLIGGWGSPFYYRGGACMPYAGGLWSCNGGLTFLTGLQLYWMLDNIADRNRIQQQATSTGVTTNYAENQPSQEELDHVRNNGGMAFDEEGEAPADGNYTVNTYDEPLPTELSVRFCVGSVGNNYDQAAGKISQYFPSYVNPTIVNTSGTPDIIAKLADGTCDMAFAQEDGLSLDVTGAASVLSGAIYPEYAHLICTEDSGIREIQDLRNSGERVAVVDESGAEIMLRNFGQLDSGYADKASGGINIVELPNSAQVQRQLSRNAAACTLMVTGKGSDNVRSMASAVDGKVRDTDDWDLNDDGQYEFGEISKGSDYPKAVLDTGWGSSTVDTMYTWASVLVRDDWFSSLTEKQREAIANAVEAAVPEIQDQVNYRP